MNSLFNPLNRLLVILTVAAASGIELLKFSIEFSEGVPNAEQANVLQGLLGFQHQLVSEVEPNDIEGSVFNASNTGSLSFQVIAPDGTVLENVQPTFAPGVPNSEATLILSRLAAYAAGTVAEAAATG